MRKAVCVVFTCKEKIFSVVRQEYLSVFPGYLAFPGGKVDKTDSNEKIDHKFFNKFDGNLMHALIREVQEEVQVDLSTLPIVRMEKIALAITPEFNPYRFETYFYWVELESEVSFKCDKEEIVSSSWKKGSDLLKEYLNGNILAVPPTIRMIERFSKEGFCEKCDELRLPYLPSSQVPWIESVSGIYQFMPLSHTFPPANRTNCFIIGDTLIDPSPKSEEEFDKLCNSISTVGFKKIFLTHHHPDHHERSPELAKKYSVSIQMSQDTHNRILKRWGSDYFNDVEINILSEGDVLTKWKDEEVLLMSVPGHDEGQLAPYVKSGKWIIAGDLFQSVGTVVVGGDEGDMAKYFASLERVIKLSPKVIYPSHGIALGGVHKLEMTLKHRKLREKQILALLKEGKTNDEILADIYEGLEESLKLYALATIEKHKVKLIQEKAL